MDKNYLVTKSNYFIMNCNYDLSLQEQKLILTLASMVQPNDEEFKPYIFKISEFMKLLGVEDKSKYTEIPKITKELIKKAFEIQEGNTLIQTAWLSSARYEKGSGAVTLKFSPDLKPYMLKLNSMFTQYKLANILSMRSKYSPRIYEILKCNEFKKQGYIEIEIEDLRKLIKAEAVYPLYANFKQKLLIVTQREVKEKTDISFDFEEIKTGRKVTSLKFIIKSNKKATDEVCVDKEDKPTLEEENHSTVLTNEIKAIFKEKINSLQANEIYDTAKGNINIIKEKYEIAKVTLDIKNIVGWMVDAIKNDYQAPKSKIKVDSFNDYPQRNYDFEKLEKKLLGWETSEEMAE